MPRHDDAGAPELRSWEQLRLSGHSHREIRRLVRDGDLAHVRHGVYAPVIELSPGDEHLRLAQATWAVLRPGATISHFTAGLVHGLPVPTRELHHVWITRAGTSGGKASGHVRTVRGQVLDTERVHVDGMWVTSLERTAADCALRTPLPDAVSLLDAALRLRADRQILADLASRWTQRRGIRILRTALDLADPRSESPGESRSRALFAMHGLPMPDLQVVVGDAHDPIGRVDFLWREQRLVGEFDGRIKYSRGMAPGGDPQEAAWQEKQREDRLRRAGFRVERWTWADTVHPAALIRRLRRALGEV